MKTIRILADDLTGALDSAAAFRGEVPVHFDRPPAESTSSAPVSVVVTPTRDVLPETLPDHLAPVVEWLRTADFPFKKVDSLLRGNTFAEIAWLINAAPFKRTTFAPAFPAQGRVTVEGRQWVVQPGDASGTRSAVASGFREAFAAFGLAAEPLPTAAVWTPDAASESDLDKVIAQATAEQARSPLLCGSAGLAFALARLTGLAPTDNNPAPPLTSYGNGPTVLISASHHPVLREQWKRLRKEMRAAATAEQGRDDEIARALEVVTQGAASAWFDLSPQEPVSPAQASALLARHAGDLIARLPKPSQLIVVGGDTLLGLCRAARVETLCTQPPVRSGWGCARLMGGHWDGVPCYSRSGAFGDPEDLLQIIRLLGGGENS